MNKKLKVGFIAFHPGATNTLTKVVHKLKEEGHEVICYPFLEYAKKEWKYEGDIYVDNENFFNNIPTDFDVILYSSAADTFVENNLPAFCKANNILCISTIDVFWIGKEEILRRFKVLPDIIITPEKSVGKMIEELNLDVEYYDYGNPHLEVDKLPEKEIDYKNKVLNYISFPNGNEILCDTDDMSKQIMVDLCEILRENNTIKKLYLSLHPRETDTFVNHLFNRYIDLIDRIEINPFENTTECCKNSDIIIGYTSTVLYEELLKGKEIIFYENKEQLKELLESESKIQHNMDFEIPKNSVENIINLIKTKREM